MAERSPLDASAYQRGRELGAALLVAAYEAALRAMTQREQGGQDVPAPAPQRNDPTPLRDNIRKQWTW